MLLCWTLAETPLRHLFLQAALWQARCLPPGLQRSGRRAGGPFPGSGLGRLCGALLAPSPPTGPASALWHRPWPSTAAAATEDRTPADGCAPATTEYIC